MNTNPYAPPKAPVADADRIDATEFEYAGFWRRVLASIVDSIIIGIITAPLLALIYGSDYWLGESDAIVQGPADVLISWVFPIVWTVAFWLKKGATPGKMLVGIRIVRAETGEPLSVGRCLGRYVSYFVSALVFCLGFLWVVWDDRKQGWHDKIADTVVIKV